MSNVYYVGSESLTFGSIEKILTENMKLELSSDVKDRIQRCPELRLYDSSVCRCQYGEPKQNVLLCCQ